ncbi:DUF3347 domain-containing protein [Coraliomargarita sp. SDUM461004]|uniref:DUF3347 domain-containing protein n=1 Tax=Thalassobacterium sedimentorum TaxID=3041258 RepID=A0ABU1AM61_9BACT|nr:DUF3347 domain-containing protein [Coraliomargarita sp. SDUM461004]MDQ8195897.1 DUF3347 domain-containing protein [Coraliomargarita sp. SDUM461004]
MNTHKYILLAFSLLLGQSAFAHSQAFKPEFVDTLLAPYLRIQNSLAGDQLEHSKAAAAEMLTALNKGPQSQDTQATMIALKKSAAQLNQAQDFKAARAAFSQLSKKLISLLEQVGPAYTQEVYIAHCPMALNAQGGTWLQESTTVENPYYGSMMLRCGTINQTPIHTKPGH